MEVFFPLLFFLKFLYCPVESRCNELESVNERLKQGMRTEFRVQLMKLPLSVR